MGLFGRMCVDACLLQQETLWDLGSQPCRDALINPAGEAVTITI